MKIPDGDRSLYEDEVISRACDLALRYDNLNITNLASFELLIRRKQLIAEAHRDNPGAPSYAAADHFLEQGFRPGGAIVVPSLSRYVSKKLEAEAAVAKEKRKLEEARGYKGRGKKGLKGENSVGAEGSDGAKGAGRK